MRNPRPTALYVGKIEAIPLKSRTRQDCPSLSYHSEVVLEALTGTIRQGREIKGIQVDKEVKLCLLVVNIILYIKEIKILPENF